MCQSYKNSQDQHSSIVSQNIKSYFSLSDYLSGTQGNQQQERRKVS